MAYQAELRKFQRCCNTIGKVLISTDRIHWTSIELKDISAGGLKFASDRVYDSGTKFYLNIYMYNMLSEFNLEFEAAIVRETHLNNHHLYALQFINPGKYHQIQLDEVIKSKIACSEDTGPLCDDGVYTYLFIPRMRKSRLMNYR